MGLNIKFKLENGSQNEGRSWGAAAYSTAQIESSEIKDLLEIYSLRLKNSVNIKTTIKTFLFFDLLPK